ncbi:hypothetical protein [Halolamina salifodinae]|uniref:Uncharacterized protein n=1 Tax=Halolamina salifodinae TaxID=1202767 RepID=A0A8T4GW91_9EURY|nr:hypothetical protein [Halolamina salifodinae]MBP1985954.1 hypothetical protein [Halolamina salifodinae]
MSLYYSKRAGIQIVIGYSADVSSCCLKDGSETMAVDKDSAMTAAAFGLIQAGHPLGWALLAVLIAHGLTD